MEPVVHRLPDTLYFVVAASDSFAIYLMFLVLALPFCYRHRLVCR